MLDQIEKIKGSQQQLPVRPADNDLGINVQGDSMQNVKDVLASCLLIWIAC